MDPADRRPAADRAAPVHPLIAARWSPRGLDASATVSDEQLRALFEAARWAASSGNLQPYRYLLGRRGSPTFDRIFGVLKPRNQRWAGAAAALALGIAVTADSGGRPIPYGVYDLGQATAQLALQAVALGLVVHQMAGFLPDAARREFALPAHHEPTVAVAIGVLGSPDGLPDDLRAREARPRSRRPLAETVFTGSYGVPALGVSEASGDEVRRGQPAHDAGDHGADDQPEQRGKAVVDDHP
jgi:nitroreductase